MRHRRLVSALTAGLVAGGVTLAAAPAASAADAPAGTASLASVLLADGNRFDRTWYDFDIVTEAVLLVLQNKPSSPVGLLTDGTVPLTAFIPNDRAFQVLVADVAGRWFWSEEAVFTAAGTLGVDEIEKILLYHVVPGATINSAAALQADEVPLTTAQGGTFTVDVLSKRYAIVQLRDADRNDVNPFLVRGKLDLNAGNQQIAHGITFVLRPQDY